MPSPRSSAARRAAAAGPASSDDAERLDPIVAALAARFRRQRPIRGGSLIVTIFGDAIAPRGGTIALSSLIGLAEPFGLGERLVRTSVARLVDEHWLERRREGRVSEYALSAIGRERFAAATRRIYTRPDGAWDGRWTVVLVPGLRGPRRERLRDALRWAGFGEPLPGTFMRAVTAGRSASELATQLRELGHAEAARQIAATGMSTPTGSEGIALLEAAATSGVRGSAALVAAGWRLDTLAASYRRFVRRFDALLELARQPRELAPLSAFVARTLLVHEYRRVQLRDPLLPDALLPRDWPGTAAYELCRQVYSRTLQSAEQHLSAVATRLADSALPEPDPALWSRFGHDGLR